MQKKHPDEVFKGVLDFVRGCGYGLSLDTKIVIVNTDRDSVDNAVMPPTYTYCGADYQTQ